MQTYPRFRIWQARNVEFGVYMQTQHFNEHVNSAELGEFTFYVSRVSNRNKLRNQGQS